MNTFFADLHIHIGRNKFGKPVKITGSKSLTITNVLKEASERKGMDLVGVIDCHAPAVMSELEDAIQDQMAVELEEGGVRYQNTTLLLGSEIEIYDNHCRGPIHVLCYFPTINKMKQFSQWLVGKMRNLELSSQRFYGEAVELQRTVKELDGLFIPAHIFTPFKSLYGKGVHRSLKEVLDPSLIDAIELGLSSDTQMADQIKELHEYPFLSNSDAHSLAKIGREYQQLQMKAANFDEWYKALRNVDGRKIIANYGLNPKLGKYHNTVCKECLSPIKETPCPHCGATSMIKGVADRIMELSSNGESPERPPYIYQVPLEYVPGLGRKTFEKLLDHFGNEMNIIHFVEKNDLIDVVGEKIANSIINIRKGKVEIITGGGGRYGKIT